MKKIIWKRTLNVLAEDRNYLDICDFEGESEDFEFTQIQDLGPVTHD